LSTEDIMTFEYDWIDNDNITLDSSGNAWWQNDNILFLRCRLKDRQNDWRQNDCWLNGSWQNYRRQNDCNCNICCQNYLIQNDCSHNICSQNDWRQNNLSHNICSQNDLIQNDCRHIKVKMTEYKMTVGIISVV